MNSWESGDVDAGKVRLHYTRTGGAKSPLVLAHGVTDSGLCWTPVADALQGDYDVIMVDARGHGESSAADTGYGPDVQADDLHAVITALGLDTPIVLGHSMGAATTLVLAGTYPHAVGAIVLEDPPAWWMPLRAATAADEERLAQVHQHAQTMRAKDRAALVAWKRSESPLWAEAELAPWADAKLRYNVDVLSVYHPANPSQVDWPATMRRISCPALLISADPALGAIVTDETAAALRALVPQLEVAHISGAGHNVRREQFAPYMNAVRAFLAAQR